MSRRWRQDPIRNEGRASTGTVQLIPGLPNRLLPSSPSSARDSARSQSGLPLHPNPRAILAEGRDTLEKFRDRATAFHFPPSLRPSPLRPSRSDDLSKPSVRLSTIFEMYMYTGMYVCTYALEINRHLRSMSGV